MKQTLRSQLVNNIGPAYGEWPTRGHGKMLEPGIVVYDNSDGSKTTYLLTREAIAAGRASATGKPIVGRSGGFDHMKVNAQDAASGKYDGEVFAAMDDGDGWEGIDFILRDPETKDKCRDGYEFSCAYIPTETDGTPGLWHNSPYNEKITNLEYTHFCVTPTPRYKGATIELFNSTGGGIVNKTIKALLAAIVPIKQLKEIVNSIEEDEKKAGDIKAKKAEAKNAYDEAMKNAKTDEEKAKAKADLEKVNAMYNEANDEADLAMRVKKERVQALRNEADALEKDLTPMQALGGGDVTPEPGVPGQSSQTEKKPVATNAEETPEQKAEREKKALEAKNAADESAAKEKAEKEALEKKNAEDAKAKEDEEKKNSLELKNKAAADAKLDALRTERFNSLRQVAEERGGSNGSAFVGVVTAQEKEDLGRDRYGSR